MPVIDSGVAASSQQVVENTGASRTVLVSRGTGFGLSATTGTIAAALAANASIFAMRLDPGSPQNAFIERIRVSYTTIVAYTVPVTALRRLELYRGSGAASSGGTSIPTTVRKRAGSLTSECDVANGGDTRIATTAGLTVTGITFETVPIRHLSLSHVGAAGGFVETLWEFHAAESQPLQLEPGNLLAIRNPVAMDAAGTWTASISVDWYEGSAL